jgi:hypothetical protein
MEKEIGEDGKEIVAPVLPPELKPNEPETPEGEIKEPTDADFDKKLSELQTEPIKVSKYSEREKAEHTLNSIKTRFPDLVPVPDEELPTENDRISEVQNTLTRQQVEGIMRASSKSESEVNLKMWFYDNRIVKTGNIYRDADDAAFLANKEFTRSAIKDMRRNPPTEKEPSGPGQRPVRTDIPPLPQSQIDDLVRAGFQQTAPDLWEGSALIVKFNKASRKWEQLRKPRTA